MAIEAKTPESAVHLIYFNDRPVSTLNLQQADLPAQTGQFERYLSSIGYEIVSQDRNGDEGGWQPREQDGEIPVEYIAGGIVIALVVGVLVAKKKEGKPLRGKPTGSNTNERKKNGEDRFGTHGVSDGPAYGQGGSANDTIIQLTSDTGNSSWKAGNDRQGSSGNWGYHRTGYTNTGPGPGDEARNNGNNPGQGGGQGESDRGERRSGNMGLTTAANVLGINKNAGDTTVNRAYRSEALKHHPDRGGNVEDMKNVNIAHDRFTKEK